VTTSTTAAPIARDAAEPRRQTAAPNPAADAGQEPEPVDAAPDAHRIAWLWDELGQPITLREAGSLPARLRRDNLCDLYFGCLQHSVGIAHTRQRRREARRIQRTNPDGGTNR
jgi:hypothetical protein